MSQNSLNPCSEPTKPNDIRLDPDKNHCTPDVNVFNCDGEIESRFTTHKSAIAGDTDATYQKDGLGSPIYCDPMLSGKIVNDPTAGTLSPKNSVVYRYSQGIRGADE